MPAPAASQHTRADGSIIRPSLVLLDDPQTRVFPHVLIDTNPDEHREKSLVHTGPPAAPSHRVCISLYGTPARRSLSEGGAKPVRRSLGGGGTNHVLFAEHTCPPEPMAKAGRPLGAVGGGHRPIRHRPRVVGPPDQACLR